ncbi:transcriptional regulator [Staphylococcus lugdunensis]|uniref:general stress protein n=1 Tax=Staphylococcus lugdunensis TaxID=28035 RepID=UPI000DA3D766|nr:general stress protein [Staphylococcus lugdunensis]SQE72704.1 transcriptional regulator [Staphylococcus lugdunensis]
MTNFTIVNNDYELYKVLEDKKAEGYLENELMVISKSKIHLDDLHNSQITLIATSGSFSDQMSKLLTGEDGEHAVLSRFHLNDEELEKYKSEILNNKMLVVAERDDSSHKEVDEHNSAYENIDITHYANESKGPKS